MGSPRRNLTSEQFISHTREMRESAAWRALPNNARRVVERLELEHMHHGGRENGRLPCTYGDFEKAGIRRKSIALAIRQAEALGFLEVVKRGYIASTGFRAPSTYRLTHVHNADKRKHGLPTHEWRMIKDQEGAARALDLAAAGKGAPYRDSDE
jgi:hypothetical protein